MKKRIALLGVLLTAAGISTARAGQVVPAGYAPGYVQPVYGHQDLHRDLKQERKQLEWEIRQAREALHQELKRDRAHGVPSWERKAKHEAAHDRLKAWRRGAERELQQAHELAHESVRR